MTERITRDQYRIAVGLKAALPTRPKQQRDMRWHHTLHQQLALHPALKAFRLETEFLFHPARKFRFDFCYPEKMVAVEVEGIVSDGKSRHQTYSGYQQDCVKYNEAAVLGWRVLRVTKDQIKSGQAIAWVEDALRGRV